MSKRPPRMRNPTIQPRLAIFAAGDLWQRRRLSPANHGAQSEACRGSNPYGAHHGGNSVIQSYSRMQRSAWRTC